MGDFFLDGVFGRIRDYFEIPETEVSTEPVKVERQEMEQRFEARQYFRRPTLFFQDKTAFETFRPCEKKVSLSELLDQAGDGLLDLARGLKAYSDRGLEYVLHPKDFGGILLQAMVLTAFGGGADRKTGLRQNKDGDFRGSFKFRGKRYEIETHGDVITVNGNHWKFEGSTSRTKAATIRVEKFDFNQENETLELAIEGSLAFFQETVSKSFQGDQIAALLESLTNSSDSLATPEMQAKGIRLIRVEAA
jgi:hypothetical protein